MFLCLFYEVSHYPFHNGGSYYIETSPLICSPNQCIGFYIIGTSVMKVLTQTKTLKMFFK